MQTKKLIDHLQTIQARISANMQTAIVQAAVTEVAALIAQHEGPANQFVFDIKAIPVSLTHPIIAGPQVSALIAAYISFLESGLGRDDSDAALLSEIEDLLRNVPDSATIAHETNQNFIWLGRVSAAIEKWQPSKTIPLSSHINSLRSIRGKDSFGAFGGIMTLLHEARAALRMKTVGPVNIAVGQGAYFEYFDEVRKIFETSTKDLLIIDPYLDAEFVSRYLSHVKTGVQIRLLSRDKLSTLLPAVEAFCKQTGAQILIRSTTSLHDRYVIIDERSCYQSGASFKDGAKNAPTTLTEITDAFTAVRGTYEKLWSNGKVER